jgi:hypothetical protein
MKYSEPQQLHILLKLRFSDDDIQVGDAIETHNSIVREHGSVWLGKLGSPLRKELNELIASQIRGQIQSKLFLFYGPKDERRYYVADIISIRQQTDPPSKRFPDYYRAFRRDIHQWFEISLLKLADDDEISRLVVASSGKPVLEVAPRCMTAHLVVTHNSKKLR